MATVMNIQLTFKCLLYVQVDNCCFSMASGKYVKAYCTGALEKGTCEDCDLDTYTEHDNGLPQCLKCTKCRSGKFYLTMALCHLK